MNVILRHSVCGFPLSLSVLERHPDNSPARASWDCPVCGQVGVGVWCDQGALDLGLVPRDRIRHAGD